DATERRVEHRQRRAVAEAPDQSLGRGRHQLAMLAEIFPVGREEHRRAIQRAAIALDHAGDEIDLALARGLADRIERLAGDVDRIVPVALEVVASFLGARADDEAKIHPARIAADERFGEQDELRATARSVGGEVGELGDRAVALVLDRGCLHDGNDVLAHSYPGAKGGHGATVSRIRASRSVMSSRWRRTVISKPTGNPSDVTPAGTEIDGFQPMFA